MMDRLFAELADIPKHVWIVLAAGGWGAFIAMVIA